MLQRLLGVVTLGSYSVGSENAQRQRNCRKQANQCRSSSGPPIKNQVRKRNAYEGRENTSNQNDDSEGAEKCWQARPGRRANQHDSDSDATKRTTLLLAEDVITLCVWGLTRRGSAADGDSTSEKYG